MARKCTAAKKCNPSGYTGNLIYRRIVQAKMYIDSHFYLPVSIDHISDKAFYSKFHFIRIFRQIYGLTPYQYLKRVRIENAIRMLEKNLTVSEVCVLVGFESLGSFSTLFKKWMGISPSDYALAYKEKQLAKKKNPQAFIPVCFAEKMAGQKNSNFKETPHSN